MYENKTGKPRVILAAVDTGEYDAEVSMDELEQLADTAGAETVARLIQKRPAVDNAAILGSGRLEELAELCKNENADMVIFDCELTASQVRNIEKATDTHTIDRTTLILDIFAQRAITREGRLQVELAQYKYRLPRLAGMGVQLSRLGGGIGTRGPGETKLETDKRHIRSRIRALEEELKSIGERRSRVRTRRKKDDVLTCAIVGYTNAGKSTLLNALTDADVMAEDKLFATLDITSRRVILPDGRRILMTDTVGLISRLPHELVEAFKSTLEEAANADVILHVIDAADPECRQKTEVAERLLRELGCEGIPTVTVFNKCDRINVTDFPGVCMISAKHGRGLDELLKAVAEALPDNSISGRYLFPYGEESLLSQIYELGRVADVKHTEGGIEADITLDRKYLRLLEGAAQIRNV